MNVREAIILTEGSSVQSHPNTTQPLLSMAMICGKPFLEILIEHFQSKGITHFVLSVSHISHPLIKHFDKRYPSIEITFSRSEHALGVGGAICKAFEHVIGDCAFVFDGHSLLDIDLEIAAQHIASSLPIIYGVHKNQNNQLLSSSREILQYVDRNNRGAECLNSGVYFFNKNSVKLYKLKQYFSTGSDFLHKIHEDNNATIVLSKRNFIDIGVRESQLDTERKLKPYIRKKALFLDRDGVINIDTGYLYKAVDCIFVDGISDLIKKAKCFGYVIIVVTNQSGIGRGYYTEEEFHQFMSWMNVQLNNQIDDYFFCPYHPKHGVKSYKSDSWDRKPNPGMLEKAIQKHNISPLRSLMIGDNITDIEAARAARVARPLLFNSNQKKVDDVTAITSLPEVEKLLFET